MKKPEPQRREHIDEALEDRDRAPVKRRAALDRMVEIAEEAGLYTSTARPKRTR